MRSVYFAASDGKLFPFLIIKAVPLHAMEAHGVREGIAHTHS
jgi:hypothetical protein